MQEKGGWGWLLSLQQEAVPSLAVLSALCSIHRALPSLALHWHLHSGGAFRATPWWGTEPVLEGAQNSPSSHVHSHKDSQAPQRSQLSVSRGCQHLTALPVGLPCQAGAAVCSQPCEHTHTRCPAAPGLLADVTWVPEAGQAQQCLLPRMLWPTWRTPRGSRGKSHSQVFTARPHSGPLVSSLLPLSPPPAAPRTEIVPG